jgi:hypothetical protein
MFHWLVNAFYFFADFYQMHFEALSSKSYCKLKRQNCSVAIGGSISCNVKGCLKKNGSNM